VGTDSNLHGRGRRLSEIVMWAGSRRAGPTEPRGTLLKNRQRLKSKPSLSASPSLQGFAPSRPLRDGRAPGGGRRDKTVNE